MQFLPALDCRQQGRRCNEVKVIHKHNQLTSLYHKGESAPRQGGLCPDHSAERPPADTVRPVHGVSGPGELAPPKPVPLWTLPPARGTDAQLEEMKRKGQPDRRPQPLSHSPILSCSLIQGLVPAPLAGPLQDVRWQRGAAGWVRRGRGGGLLSGCSGSEYVGGRVRQCPPEKCQAPRVPRELRRPQGTWTPTSEIQRMERLPRALRPGCRRRPEPELQSTPGCV